MRNFKERNLEEKLAYKEKKELIEKGIINKNEKELLKKYDLGTENVLYFEKGTRNGDLISILSKNTIVIIPGGYKSLGEGKHKFKIKSIIKPIEKDYKKNYLYAYPIKSLVDAL